MKLSEVKTALKSVDNVKFSLPNGHLVPNHFHITEVGLVTKDFIDCGGTRRNETVVNFQLWNANDYDHRLKPEKLLNIIDLSEKVLGIGDFEIEVEYQENTIGKFGLDFDGQNFLLVNKNTACLASDECGIPSTSLESFKSETYCTPGGGCC